MNRTFKRNICAIINVVAAFIIVVLANIGARCIMEKFSKSNKNDVEASVGEEDRAFPSLLAASAVSNYEVDSAVAERLRTAGYSTNFAPVTVIGGESNKK